MIRSLGMTAAVAAASTGALAHHGFGTFDLDRDIEIRGVFTRVDFVNPHTWLYLEVVQDDGSRVTYRCEMRAATVLRRSGWSPEMFTAGEEITVTGSPDRNDPYSCYVGTVIFADGGSIDRYGQRTAPRPPAPLERPLRLASGEPNISGDWAPEQLVMTDPRGQAGALVPLSQAPQFEPGEVPGGGAAMRGSRGGPPDPRSSDDDEAASPPPPPPSIRVEPTEVGRRAAEAFDMWSPDNPRMRCETTSILFDWTFDGPINRITQEEDLITLQYGQLGFTRVILVNAGEHPEDIEPSRAGHSIGRWEDDVLVVDTVGFEPGLLNPPIFHGEQLRVVERFSLDPQTMALTREYVAEDPEYFVGQYTGSDTVFPADLGFAPDACEELTFVNFADVQRQEEQARAEDAPAGEEAAERRPWWRFRD